MDDWRSTLARVVSKEEETEMPKRHSRELIVSRAGIDISQAVIDTIRKYDLTYGELHQLLAMQIASSCKYEIREERHGDASEPGGLESDD